MSAKNKLVFATVVAGLGFGCGSFVDAVDSDNVQDTQEIVRTAETHALQADHGMVELEERIGESCLSFLRVYASKAPLGGTPEDSIVSDLINDPDQPCTGQTDVIREHTRAFINTDTELEAAKAELTEQKNILSGHITSNKREDDMLGLYIGASIGAVLAGGVAIFDRLDP